MSAPQLVGIAVLGSLRKTHLWDLDKKLIKRFFDSDSKDRRKTLIMRIYTTENGGIARFTRLLGM